MEKDGGSRLMQMQARFQQRQMLEKEQKMVAMYEAQQARALTRVCASPATMTQTPPSAVTQSAQRVTPGKVRQMFEERRTKGIDKSYPLQPIQNRGERNPPRKQLPNGYVKVALSKTKPLETKTSKTAVVTTHSIRKQKAETMVNGSGDLNHNTQPDTTAIKLSNNNTCPRDAERLDPSSEQLDGARSLEKLDNLEDETFPEGMASSPTPRTPASPPPRLTKHVQAERSNPAANKSPSKPNTRASPPARAVAPAARRPPSDITTVTNKPPPARTEKSPRTAMIRSAQPPSASKGRLAGSASSGARAVTAGAETARGGEGGGEPCAVCGRRFASDRLQKHEEICRKAHAKRRKPYDALKHRLGGTEAEPFIKQIRKQPPAKSTPAQQKENKALNSSWRQKHEDFIRAIRAAKEAQAYVAAGGKLSDLPPPPPSENPDYVACPHCGRRFNQGAAERHIPKCQNFQFNKPKPQAAKRR